MRKEIFIVTNNKMVINEYPAFEVLGDLDAVFLKVRDLVHEGCVIMTHPLSGSVKPHETEFKSIVLAKGDGAMNLDSLHLIENAITTSAKFKKPKRDWGIDNARVENDFMSIDYSLLKTGLEGLGTTLYKLIDI
jgi:hypothetical protein